MQHQQLKSDIQNTNVGFMNRKNRSLYEDYGDDFFDSCEADEVEVPTSVSDEEMFKLAIGAAKTSGSVDKIISEYVKQISENLPELKFVKNMDDVYSTQNSYYVTDDVTFVINMDVNTDNVGQFMKLFRDKNHPIIVDRLVGDFYITGNCGFTGFPFGFPQEINGSLSIIYCDSFDDAVYRTNSVQMEELLRHAPKAVSRMVDIVVFDRVFQTICDTYIKNVKKLHSDNEIEICSINN